MSLPLLGTAARYFLEVARVGSLTRAAEHLHVAPSAISRQIAKLEDSLDCALFERKARGMVLSEAGERLAVYARTTALDAQRAIDEVKGMHKRAATRLRVACTEGFSSDFMTGLLSDFHRKHPESHIEVAVTTPDGVTRLLLARAVEIGIKFSVLPEKGLRIEHQRPAPIMLVAARGHPLARRKRVSLAEALCYPLALPSPETTLRQMLQLAFSMQGHQCDATFTASFSILLGLVKRGDALTFAAQQSVAHLVRSKEVVAIRVPELAPYQRYLQILSSEDAPLTGVTAVFLKTIIVAVK